MKPEIKKFVFRVANGINEGPFRSRKSWYNCRKMFYNVDKFNNPELYPNFNADDIFSVTKDHLAALPNACTLFHWFGEDLDLLYKNKFLVHRVEVKQMTHGKTNMQVIYHKKREKVGKMQIVPIKYKGLLL